MLLESPPEAGTKRGPRVTMETSAALATTTARTIGTPMPIGFLKSLSTNADEYRKGMMEPALNEVLRADFSAPRMT